MAHEITTRDGLVLNQVPAWHGLGTVVENAPTVEGALQLAGLDWEVSCTPVQTQSVRGLNMELAEGYCGIRRADTDELFAIMGDGWVPIQNRELAEFANALGEEGNIVRVETAGSIRSGRRVWFLLRGQSIFASKQDEVRPYVLLANGHDGTLSMSARFTSVRVVCNNTLGSALGKRAADVFTVRHVGNMQQKLNEAKRVLGIFTQQRDTFADAVATLNAREMNKTDLQRFFVDVYTQTIEAIPDAPKTEKDRKRRSDALEAIGTWVTNFDKDRQRTGGGATAWTAANAVTEWFDHQKMVRGKDDTARKENRVYASLWGQSAGDKVGVFKAALALV